MSGKASANLRTLTVENRVLTDFFRTQTNLVIVAAGGAEKGFRLTRDDYKMQITL
jgi:hypothetical protein